MRRGSIIGGLLVFMLLTGSAVQALGPNGEIPILPTSERADKAIKKRMPKLFKQVSAAGFEWGAPVLIRIFKRESRLEVWLGRNGVYSPFRDYKICAWSGKLGPKIKQGDRQSPEGFYHVQPGNLNPNSQYHLSFNLGFPNAYDRAHGRTGTFLMVHGNCGSSGCYAIGKRFFFFWDNSPIEEVWTLMAAAYASGQDTVQVQAYPFELTPENLDKEADSKWIDFWRNLAEGETIFRATGRPPLVSVDSRKRYAFSPRPKVKASMGK